MDSGSWLSPIKNILLVRLTTSSKAIKWAVSDRRKFEKTLVEFKKWNGQLRGFALLFGGIVLTPQLYTQQGGDYVSASRSNSIVSKANSDVRRLDLVPHIRIRELASKPDLDSIDYNLENSELVGSLKQPESLTTISIHRIKESSTRKVQPQPVLAELKEYTSSNMEDVELPSEAQEFDKNQVQQLASMLSTAQDSSLHTLPFKGYILQGKTENHRRYAFVYDFPAEANQTEPISLHDLLSSPAPTTRLPLPSRFEIARTIATTIGTLHADGWLHKSIRSHNLIFFSSNSASSGFTQPYLVGFEYSRLESAETEATWDTDLVKNLYRHPERQGPPLVTFAKRYDVYALGLVLLEIGLWRTLSDLWEEAREKTRQQNGKLSPLNRRLNVEYFAEAAKHNLAHTMGEAYAEAVSTCLDLRPSGDFQQHERPDGTDFYVNILRKLDIENLLKS